jgi:hypothetical protein
VAKKTARKAAPNTATPPAQSASRGGKPKPVDIKLLRTMLEQLKNELLDDESENGVSRKNVSALLRIGDLLPLIEHCQQSMTRP